MEKNGLSAICLIKMVLVIILFLFSWAVKSQQSGSNPDVEISTDYIVELPPPPENFTGINGAAITSWIDWSLRYYINLNWDTPDSETPPTGYNLYYSETKVGPYSSVSTVGTDYELEVLSTETESCWFYVTAVYDTEESAPTDTINVIPDAPILTIDGETVTSYLYGVEGCWSCWEVDSHWYKFYAPAISSGDNTVYEILANGELDLSLFLYENDMSTLNDQDNNSVPYYDAQLGVTNSTGEWFYLEVTGSDVPGYAIQSTSGYYTVSIKASSEPPVKTIIVDQPYYASYIHTSETDEYWFTTGRAGTYTIETNGPLNTFLGLYDSYGMIEQNDDDGEDFNAMIKRELEANTTYAVRMTASTGGEYSIIVESPAVELELNDPCYQSSIYYYNETDWYKFQTGPAGTYTLNQSSTFGLYVSLYENDKTTLKASSYFESFESELDSNTVYFIRILSDMWRPPEIIDDTYCIGLTTLTDNYPTYSEYLFEESSGTSVFDSNGANHGNIINNVNRVKGVLNNGLEFTGSGYVSLGECFGSNVQNEVTLSAWIKPYNITGDYQGIIMHGGPNVDSYALYIRPLSKEIAFKTSGTTNSWLAVKDLDYIWDGNWHHVVVVYNGSQKIIYIDNVIINSVVATGTIESGKDYNLLIGAGRDLADPGLLFEGLMDEVRIYNYALTNHQVSELYEAIKTNQAPVADAGSDQVADEGTIITLDGSGSSDADGNALTYQWTAPAGITLSSATAQKPTFTAPEVSADTDYTFSLVVNDGTSSSTSVVVVTVKQVNKAPVANAGTDQSVNEGATITLDGSASSDPDGNALTYLWTAPAGVTLSSATVQKPTFTAPEVTADTDYTFTLTVNDGAEDSVPDQVIITVKNVAEANQSPIANAGTDQTVNEGATVTLDGSSSSDPDGDALTYLWTAPEGVTLSSATAQKPTFIAPELDADTDFIFSLVVNDGTEDSAPEQVLITVKNVVVTNQPPVANVGNEQTITAGDTVWIDATASYDPDGNELTFIWTSPDGITLNTTDVTIPYFIAPEVAQDTIFEFILELFDGMEYSVPAIVKITVKSKLSVGVPQTELFSFNIYPNPSTGKVNLQLEHSTEDYVLKVYNNVGKIIFIKNDSENYNWIDLSNQAEGVYFIRITKGQEQQTRKLILKK